MKEALPYVLLVVASIAALGAAYAAWRILIAFAEILVAIDRALFRRRRRVSRAAAQVQPANFEDDDAHAFEVTVHSHFTTHETDHAGALTVGGLNLPVEFTYHDLEGVESRRRVMIHAVKTTATGRPDLATGFCLLVRAERSFHIRAMTDVVDTVTGEIIDAPVRWFDDRLKAT